MLGKKVKFTKPKLPSQKYLLGKFVTLEPINPKKHKTDLFECFKLDKKGKLWTYMSDGPFKNLNQLEKYINTLEKKLNDKIGKIHMPCPKCGEEYDLGICTHN